MRLTECLVFEAFGDDMEPRLCGSPMIEVNSAEA